MLGGDGRDPWRRVGKQRLPEQEWRQREVRGGTERKGMDGSVQKSGCGPNGSITGLVRHYMSLLVII